MLTTHLVTKQSPLPSAHPAARSSRASNRARAGTDTAMQCNQFDLEDDSRQENTFDTSHQCRVRYLNFGNYKDVLQDSRQRDTEAKSLLRPYVFNILI